VVPRADACQRLPPHAKPRPVRFAPERIETSLQAVSRLTNARQTGCTGRLAGRLRATLDYSQVDRIMADNVHNCLENIQRQCAQILWMLLANPNLPINDIVFSETL
jgi:uncharacterized alpha-E superfamily protein